MSGEIPLTVVGNLTADPELRYTQNGIPVASGTIACTPRRFDRASNEWSDGDTVFLRYTVWREYAEHVATSLSKGTGVIAKGTLSQRSYETKPTDGSAPEKRTAYELEVEDIGPSLRYAVATVNRTTKREDPKAPRGAHGAPVPAGAPSASADAIF